MNYFLDESQEWGINVLELENIHKQYENKGVNPRIFVVINPGNPTGNVLSRSNMVKIVEFCERKSMILLADEVYQENIYNPEKQFISFKQIIRDLNSPVQLISFHSTSKGLAGECGLRGGYMEMTNLSDEVYQQLFKLKSINLCSNTTGQLMTDLLVNPPNLLEGISQETIDAYHAEKKALFDSLKRRASNVEECLRSMTNIELNEVEGAMYAFPSLHFSDSVIKKAENMGVAADTFYCLELLKKTGIVVVPGSGFGQRPGTHHFRMTTLILPEEKLYAKLEDFRNFNEQFHQQY